VHSNEERQLVRRLAGPLRGVCVVWDRIQILGCENIRVIDIGCAKVKQYPWAIGIDRARYAAVDLIADLEFGLPIAESSVDHVFAIHVLEHVHELIALMNEVHRVLKPSGVLHVLAPYWQHPNAVADPTHVCLFSIATFKYFCLPHPGIKPFLPLTISETADTVYADLQPIRDGESLVPEDRLVW
jgi:SAM-dependent methyltransferase